MGRKIKKIYDADPWLEPFSKAIDAPQIGRLNFLGFCFQLLKIFLTLNNLFGL